MTEATRRGSRPVVVVTRRLPAAVESAIAERVEARFNTLDHPLDVVELQAAMREADGVLCTVTDRISAEVLRVAGRRARIVANFGVGVNNIDLAAARDCGVTVTNTPDVLTEDTADLAISLLLAVARRIGEGERLVRADAWTGWTPTQLLGTSVGGKTLGVVGYGRIGRATARRAHFGFGMRVLYHSRRRHDAAPGDPPAEFRAELDELLAASDVVSLHCPSTPETRHLVDARALAAMRPSAFLVNTARGDVVDEAALVDALRAGRIAGAGLDVYEREPRLADGLRDLPNVVLLPHLGSATTETRVAMGLRALANLEAFLGGREPPDRVS